MCSLLSIAMSAFIAGIPLEMGIDSEEFPCFTAIEASVEVSQNYGCIIVQGSHGFLSGVFKDISTVFKVTHRAITLRHSATKLK